MNVLKVGSYKVRCQKNWPWLAGHLCLGFSCWCAALRSDLTDVHIATVDVERVQVFLDNIDAPCGYCETLVPQNPASLFRSPSDC